MVIGDRTVVVEASLLICFSWAAKKENDSRFRVPILTLYHVHQIIHTEYFRHSISIKLLVELLETPNIRVDII